MIKMAEHAKCATTLIGIAMSQAHYRVKELDKQDNDDNRPQTCSAAWHRQVEES